MTDVGDGRPFKGARSLTVDDRAGRVRRSGLWDVQRTKVGNDADKTGRGLSSCRRPSMCFCTTVAPTSTTMAVTPPRKTPISPRLLRSAMMSPIVLPLVAAGRAPVQTTGRLDADVMGERTKQPGRTWRAGATGCPTGPRSQRWRRWSRVSDDRPRG